MVFEFIYSFVASSILQEVVDRMKAIAADTINLACKSDIETELTNLKATYLRAEEIIGKIDGWDLVTSKLHRDVLGEIRSSCYNVEDYTEYLEIEILSKIGDANFVWAFLNKVWTLSELRNLREGLHGLISDPDRLHVLRRYQHRSYPDHYRFYHRYVFQCHQFQPESVNWEQLRPDLKIRSVGLAAEREKDKHAILAFFLQSITGGASSSSSSSRCSSMMTVSIAGMFGIGKSTLAFAVCNDPDIRTHFPQIIGVSVSGAFGLFQTLRSIMTNLAQVGRLMSPQIPADLPADQIITMFRDVCRGKRILLVLDDLCSFQKAQPGWKEFQSVLCSCSCAMFGVIITTRNPRVAAIVASLSSFPTRTHYLQRMSDEECASIITNNLKQSEHYCRGFPASGKKSKMLDRAQKFCQGLPLVAEMLGNSALYLDYPEELSRDIWDSPEFEGRIFRTFRLNYSDLSPFLRNCFPYFSLFPKDYNFNADELFRLWMAEGYLRPQVPRLRFSDHSDLEQLRNNAIDEVISRSVLQIHSPFNQEPQTFRMHELLRRYAQFVGSDMYLMVDEEFNLNYPSSSSPYSLIEKARHVSFICQSIKPQLLKDIQKCKRLRTVLSLHKFTEIGQNNCTLFVEKQWLRVLVLSRTDINELPESLGELKHLKLLDVSDTKIKSLPRSTVKLCRLLSLRLIHCSKLLQLPRDLINLTQLLHLEVDKPLSIMLSNIGKLSNLRTLRAFMVGRKDGHRVTELKNMRHLKESLRLTNLEFVQNEAEAREAKLAEKPLLRCVELKWIRNSDDPPIQLLAERVLAGFQPHENLEELLVSGYFGAEFPSWLSSAECKLRSICIQRCSQCSNLPALGQLQLLKALVIENIHKVKYIDCQFFGDEAGVAFPRLESLKFHDMKVLEKWDGLQANHMPRLKELVITDCPKLTTLPQLNPLTSLVSLEIANCPLLEALPSKGLPSTLEKLVITSCDLLKRCLEKRRRDWIMVKHVPAFSVDGVDMSQPTLKRKLTGV